MTGFTSVQLSRDGSAAQARRFVAGQLAGAGLDELAEAATLVTTELVTNVLVHTNSAPAVRVLVRADLLRVEVEDACPVLPVAGVLDPTAGCGRGLLLVEQLTHWWGVSRVPEVGKVVWFELVAGAPAAAEELTADQLLNLWDDDPELAAAGPSPRPAPPERRGSTTAGRSGTSASRESPRRCSTPPRATSTTSSAT
jgi:anti-sigma regulatory factor (Ser/Thr protein kinase)